MQLITHFQICIFYGSHKCKRPYFALNNFRWEPWIEPFTSISPDLIFVICMFVRYQRFAHIRRILNLFSIVLECVLFSKTGETSPVITPFHFYGYSNFFFCCSAFQNGGLGIQTQPDSAVFLLSFDKDHHVKGFVPTKILYWEEARL